MGSCLKTIPDTKTIYGLKSGMKLLKAAIVFFYYMLSLTPATETFNFRQYTGPSSVRSKMSLAPINLYQNIPERDASEDWHRFIHRDSDVMMKVLMDFMKDVIDKYSHVQLLKDKDLKSSAIGRIFEPKYIQKTPLVPPLRPHYFM